MDHEQGANIPCLDLCEAITLHSDAAEQLRCIEGYLDTDGLADCSRVYLGSSFCPQALFASAGLADAALDICRRRGMNATLVLPVLAQRFYERGIAFARELVSRSEGLIDEVVVNDYGTLAELSRLIDAGGFPETLKLHLGRLMSKDTRDMRCTANHERLYRPALLQGTRGATALDALLQQFPRVSGITLDQTHVALDITGLPKGVEVAICGELVYVSTGQICEFASVGVSAEEAFRANLACKLQCLTYAERYLGASGVEFAKIGRTVYADTPDVEVVASAAYRMLISPLKEVRG